MEITVKNYPKTFSSIPQMVEYFNSTPDEIDPFSLVSMDGIELEPLIFYIEAHKWTSEPFTHQVYDDDDDDYQIPGITFTEDEDDYDY